MSKKTRHSIHVDVEIDKLTNSIELVATGDVFNTIVMRADHKDKRLIKRKEWQFDWHVEILKERREVYRLMTENNPHIIQGLVSFEDKGDHIYMHLIESAAFNRGRGKTFLGVPGNLIAYGCKLSFERGYDGFVAFTAKTALVAHYQDSLGAIVIRGTLMHLDSAAARTLVQRYKL
jgi:hypothetical protein